MIKSEIGICKPYFQSTPYRNFPRLPGQRNSNRALTRSVRDRADRHYRGRGGRVSRGTEARVWHLGARHATWCSVCHRPPRLDPSLLPASERDPHVRDSLALSQPTRSPFYRYIVQNSRCSLRKYADPYCVIWFNIYKYRSSFLISSCMYHVYISFIPF